MLAKIAVLVFIIIFIQRRPQGMFALKGRAVESMSRLSRHRRALYGPTRLGCARRCGIVLFVAVSDR